jgi:hypothetical protein
LEILTSTAEFRFNDRNGFVGLLLLQLALREFLARHQADREGSASVRVRGSYAGVNDASLAASLCAQVRHAAVLSLYLGDLVAYQDLAGAQIYSDRSLILRAKSLTASGNAREALRWLELAVANPGAHSDPDSVLNLRIAAPDAMGDLRKTLTYLTAAFLATFEAKYFEGIVKSISDENSQRIAKSQLIGAVQSANMYVVARAFQFLITQEEWPAVEKLYLKYYEKPILLFGLFGNTTGAAELVDSLSGTLPEVACGLPRCVARHSLETDGRFEVVEWVLERSMDICPMPEYHSSHVEFCADLASKFKR